MTNATLFRTGSLIFVTAIALGQDRDMRTLDEIQATVSKGGLEIKRSLPELNYVKKSPFACGIHAVDIASADKQRFQVLVLYRGAMSIPGSNMALAYLKNPEGKIVHWKSCWLSNRRGAIGARLLDVNDDGLKEFCFVCERFKRPEQVIAAYSVRDGEFDPVIAERTSYFDVVFEETFSNDLLVQPQLRGRYFWQTDKLYEIPIRITNRSAKSIDLRKIVLQASHPGFSGTYIFSGFTTNALAPKATVEATMTVRCSQVLTDKKFGFETEQRPLIPESKL